MTLVTMSDDKRCQQYTEGGKKHNTGYCHVCDNCRGCPPKLDDDGRYTCTNFTPTMGIGHRMRFSENPEATGTSVSVIEKRISPRDMAAISYAESEETCKHSKHCECFETKIQSKSSNTSTNANVISTDSDIKSLIAGFGLDPAIYRNRAYKKFTADSDRFYQAKDIALNVTETVAEILCDKDKAILLLTLAKEILKRWNPDSNESRSECVAKKKKRKCHSLTNSIS